MFGFLAKLKLIEIYGGRLRLEGKVGKTFAINFNKMAFLVFPFISPVVFYVSVCLFVRLVSFIGITYTPPRRDPINCFVSITLHYVSVVLL